MDIFAISFSFFSLHISFFPPRSPIYFLFNSSCDSCIFPSIVHIFLEFRATHRCTLFQHIRREGFSTGCLNISFRFKDFKQIAESRWKKCRLPVPCTPLAPLLVRVPLCSINRQLMSRCRICFAAATHLPLLSSPLFSPLHSFLRLCLTDNSSFFCYPLAVMPDGVCWARDSGKDEKSEREQREE